MTGIEQDKIETIRSMLGRITDVLDSLERDLVRSKKPLTIVRKKPKLKK